MDDILNITVVPPPDGQSVNLVDPPSKAYLLWMTCAICLAIGTVCTWTRVYVNLVVTRHFSWDDVLVVLCWLLVIPMIAFLCNLPRYGAFTDIWNVRLGDIEKLLKWMFWLEILYSLELLGIKTAVLILYKRIFVPYKTRNWVYYCIVAIAVFNGLFYIADIFVRIFSCTPVSGAWNLLESSQCIDVWTMIIGTACLNSVDNVLIILIPLGVVWKLQMPKKRKIEIYLVFLLNTLSLATSAMRVVYSVWASKAVNQTVVVAELSLWASAELACYFMCACVPMIPKFVRHIQRKLKRRSTISDNEEPSQEPCLDSGQSEPKGPTPILKSIPHFSTFNLSFSSYTALQTSRHAQDPYFIPEFASQTKKSQRPGMPQPLSSDDQISVDRTVEITSVPKVHVATDEIEVLSSSP